MIVIVSLCILVYRVSGNNRICGEVAQIKLSRKVLYHFVIFAVVKEEI